MKSEKKEFSKCKNEKERNSPNVKIEKKNGIQQKWKWKKSNPAKVKMVKKSDFNKSENSIKKKEKIIQEK